MSPMRATTWLLWQFLQLVDAIGGIQGPSGIVWGQAGGGGRLVASVLEAFHLRDLGVNFGKLGIQRLQLLAILLRFGLFVGARFVGVILRLGRPGGAGYGNHRGSTETLQVIVVPHFFCGRGRRGLRAWGGQQRNGQTGKDGQERTDRKTCARFFHWGLHRWPREITGRVRIGAGETHWAPGGSLRMMARASCGGPTRRYPLTSTT